MVVEFRSDGAGRGGDSELMTTMMVVKVVAGDAGCMCGTGRCSLGMHKWFTSHNKYNTEHSASYPVGSSYLSRRC